MKWFRLYHDTITDPKWRLIAIDSGQPLSSVLAVWMSMLINASDSPERGTLHDWNDRIAGAAIDLRGDAVAAIRQAMQGLVLDGDKLTGWEKRQRASDNVADRVNKHRKKTEKSDPGGDRSGGNGLDSDSHTTSRDRNATETLKTADVTLHSSTVTHFPLRAQTPDSEDSVASATGPQADPERPLKSMLFGECLKWLTRESGRPESQLRKMIGRWCRDYGEGAVLEAITVAQRDAAVSPVGYVEKILKSRSAKHGQANSSERDRLIHGLAGAFSDLMDPGSEASSGDGGAVARRYH